MSKSSAIGRPSQKTGSKGLQQEFICQVLGLQDQYKKQKNKQTLTNLIGHYRKLVEHYSEKNDNISIYFRQKISQASMEIATLQQPEEKLTMSMARQVMEQQNNTDPRFKTLITTPIKYDLEIKKKERSKNAQICIQVNKIKKRANARTILKSYYDECLENNMLINQDLQNQRKQLEQKLLKIRNLSFNHRLKEHGNGQQKGDNMKAVIIIKTYYPTQRYNSPSYQQQPEKKWPIRTVQSQLRLVRN